METETAADMKILYSGPDGNSGVYNIDWQHLYSGPTTKPYLLKDLGQTINFKVKGLLAIQWTLVQKVAGPTTEGVPDNYPAGGEGWVVTYLAETPDGYYGDAVGVMRVG